ncbi:MAG TPA: pectate lyase [Bacteroides sp.]|nr:pectate lyase [Bacteroides sp.]
MKQYMLTVMCCACLLAGVACTSDDPMTDKQEQTEPGQDGPAQDVPDEEVPDRTKVDAFPGAYGAGRYTRGGAGGRVLVVNSLADDGSEGTLRWAVSQKGARTVVFRVSGIIELQRELKIQEGDLTIAGQTAPGDGICVKNHSVVINADNVIVRFMRFRMGADALTGSEADGSDAFWGRGYSDIIIDHCSMSWSTDECASFYNNKNFTMQWCIVTESLTKSLHAKGDHGYGGIWGGSPATFHHNLLAHHSNRTPRLDGSRSSGKPDEEKVDLRNNVIYNWGGEGAYGGQGGSYNFVNNYYKPGPYLKSTNGNACSRIFTAYADDGGNSSKNELGTYGSFYVSGNYFDGSVLDNKNRLESIAEVNADNTKGIVAKNDFITTDKLLAAAEFSITDDAADYTQSAADAYESVLRYAGASLKRDAVDERVVKNVRDGDYTASGSNGSGYGFIDDPSDVGGWPVYTGEAPADSDGDGMPDDWEKERGLDPSKDDSAGYALSDSYTNLEVYMNSLVESLMGLND